MELDDVVRKRQSIREYSGKKVKWKDVIAILDAARYAPTAGHISTLRLVLVSKEEKRKKLAEAAGQEFLAFAPCIIVVCSDATQIKRSYGERGTRYARHQAGAAIENMLLKITDLGLSSCWIGAFDDDSIKRTLHIPDDIQVEALLPVAYPIAETRRSRKEELNRILYFEEWKQKAKKKIGMPEAI